MANNTGVMVALMSSPATQARLREIAVQAGLSEDELQPPEDMHITLAYLGDADEISTAISEDQLADIVTAFAQGWSPIEGEYSGIGRFTNSGDTENDVVYASFDAPALPRFREALLTHLVNNKVPVKTNHGYFAHSTLGYTDKTRYIQTFNFEPIQEIFNEISLVWMDNRHDAALGNIAMDTETQDEMDATKAARDVSQGIKLEEPAGDVNEFGMLSAEQYAYPEENKLPINDAEHVMLAAEALGSNPPHGNRVKVPSDKLGEVKARIRSRAHELNLPDDQLAKINAYLSGHMPSNLSSKQTDTWLNIFGQVLSQTKDEIKAALAAQGNLNRQAAVGVKSMKGNLPTSVEGWMMLFSDPDETDLQGTYFNDMTRTLADYYAGAPLWMEHGKDGVYGADPIGRRTKTEVYPFGVWGEHDLHTDHPLYERTAKDAADGLFSYSSDSLAHYAVQGYDPQDGYLSEWPLAGCSLTRTPAEPGLGPVQAKSFELALKSMVQQREAADHAQQGDSTSTVEESTMDDEKKELGEVEPSKDFGTPETDTEAIPGSTIEALAQMYGCEVDGVRSAIDNHIAQMSQSGVVDADLCQTLGLPADAPIEAVANRLNDLYATATTPPVEPDADDATMSNMPESVDVPDMPSATMDDGGYDDGGGSDGPDEGAAMSAGPNYGALSRHLSRESVATKSIGSGGPYMTGELGKKGINYNRSVPVPGVVDMITDMIRVKNGISPKHAWNSMKAMTSATGPTGGYVLRQEISEEILDPLRAQAACFQLGAQQEDMQGMAVKQIPAMQSAPTSNWIGENQAVTNSQPAYRMITLVPHGLQTTVPIPVNVEANMTPRAEKQLREQIVMSQTLAIDIAALTGPGGAAGAGTGAAPTGILNTPGVRQYAMNGTTSGRIPTFQDLVNVNRLLDRSNVPQQGAKRGFAMHSDIASVFTGQTDSLGRPLLRDEWSADAKSTLLNFPYRTENQIPTNVTVGTSSANTSYVFFADWRYLIIGLSDMVELRLSETFMQNLQIGLLAYVYADVKVAYPEAFIAMTGVLGADIAGATITTNS